MVEMSKKKAGKKWKWVKLRENPKNAISPMWKNYQNVLSNKNDVPLVSQSMGL